MRRTCLILAGIAYALAGILLVFIHSAAGSAPSLVKILPSLLLSAGSLSALLGSVAGVATANRERKESSARLAALQAAAAGKGASA